MASCCRVGEVVSGGAGVANHPMRLTSPVSTVEPPKCCRVLLCTVDKTICILKFKINSEMRDEIDPGEISLRAHGVPSPPPMDGTDGWMDWPTRPRRERNTQSGACLVSTVDFTRTFFEKKISYA